MTTDTNSSEEWLALLLKKAEGVSLSVATKLLEASEKQLQKSKESAQLSLRVAEFGRSLMKLRLDYEAAARTQEQTDSGTSTKAQSTSGSVPPAWERAGRTPYDGKL